MTDQAIQVSGVSYAYSGSSPRVLDEVGVVVERASSLCIVGPSGSGKSTLLSIIGGVVRPRAGSVRLLGRDLWEDVPPRHRAKNVAPETAWVMQTANLFPRLSAVRNTALGGILRGVAADEALDCASVVLSELAMESFRDVPVRNLSGGQAQRVAVARAIVSGAPIILADEPTGQLDRASTDLVVEAFVAAVRRGRTVAIASHDARVAAACDGVLELADGRPV